MLAKTDILCYDETWGVLLVYICELFNVREFAKD